MTRLPVSIFFALFTISGFAGLIYESIWSHYLKLFLGHAAYAQTLVLAIFMGGMALGAWGVSRYTHRIRDLLLAYAIAELGIGMLAIAFHRVFLGATGWAFDTVLPALGAFVGFQWTYLTAHPARLSAPRHDLPADGAGVMPSRSSGGRIDALLLTASGTRWRLATACLIDRMAFPHDPQRGCSITRALGVGWRRPARPRRGAPARDRPVTQQSAILALAAATGAPRSSTRSPFRMLTLGLGASTHTFEKMLAAFVLGRPGVLDAPATHGGGERNAPGARGEILSRRGVDLRRYRYRWVLHHRTGGRLRAL